MDGPSGLEVQAQGERGADCNDSVAVRHTELIAQVLYTVQSPGHGQSCLIVQEDGTAVLSMQKDTRMMVSVVGSVLLSRVSGLLDDTCAGQSCQSGSVCCPASPLAGHPSRRGRC